MEKIEFTLPKFSYFKGPITNLYPQSNATIIDIHRGITSDYYKAQTEQLRWAKNEDQRREAKKKLDYVCFAGTFSYRNDDSLISPSGYACIDIDHIKQKNLLGVSALLESDPLLETVLLFTSPSGSGLKWICKIDLETYPDYRINFLGIVAYLLKTYPDRFNCGENDIDTTSINISRACFLCHDEYAYLNPKYLTNGSDQI
jgi:hypothetical protein